VAADLTRFPLHLRVQHGLLALFSLAALGSGFARATGRQVAGMPPELLFQVHLLVGFGALGVIVYHAVSLAVAGYVEGRDWSTFPFRVGGEDVRSAGAELGYLFRLRAERPAADTFRVTQKALYWATFLALPAIALTGIGIAFWEHLGTLALLPALGGLHRGGGLLLAGVLLWHLYGAFVWEGSWEPEWSWITGRIGADKARRKLEGFYRRNLQEEDARAAALQGKSAEAVEEERRVLEKEEVQRALALGNQAALEEKFVEALYHYRRALEMYPGYSQARYNMARVLARMGEAAMAREAYQQFLDAEPFHPLAGKAREALRELEAEERP
jgi:cytochrome b subunit of formate dehydrogenase